MSVDNNALILRLDPHPYSMILEFNPINDCKSEPIAEISAISVRVT